MGAGGSGWAKRRRRRHVAVALRAATDSGLLLLGGEPFDEKIVMWWNFIGRSGEEIAEARADWNAGRRLGTVHGFEGAPVPRAGSSRSPSHGPRPGALSPRTRRRSEASRCRSGPVTRSPTGTAVPGRPGEAGRARLLPRRGVARQT
ncbi:hypothetical protein GCM10010254_67950 [Streptomyces chromofuscus]|nr:hypothetical protein GCM10010254_67950 [Streptomyces chromofuscus]